MIFRFLSRVIFERPEVEVGNVHFLGNKTTCFAILADNLLGSVMGVGSTVEVAVFFVVDDVDVRETS